MTASCLSSEQMRAFLSGSLANEEEGAIARHLEGCAHCERLAGELSDDREARQLARFSRQRVVATNAEPEVEDLRRRLHALGLLDMALASEHHAAGNGNGNGDGNGSRMAAADEPKASEPRLTQLGRYDIVKSLGAGSFGIVYLAEGRRLHRRVAIKVARASVLTDPALRGRFFREAEALARLEHPYILPVYEADEIEGLCFLVLAYCDGKSLDEWLGEQDRPLDPRLAARLVLPLAEAAEHAHSRGILHRDIKPGNVLLPTADAPHGLPFSPKLTDFGLAKVLEDKTDQTLAGVVLGTADYMAPEQAAGHLERFGPATDVYSLGAVLYQLLSGRVPIEGNSTIDTLRRLLIDEPAELQCLVSGVPDDLAAIVCRCLQKSPSQRYATAGELGDDLDRFLAGRPTKARPLTLRERTSRWLLRHKAVASFVALATIALGLSLGLFSYANQLSRTEHQARQTEEELGEARERDASRALELAEKGYASDLFAAGVSTSKGDVSHAIE